MRQTKAIKVSLLRDGLARCCKMSAQTLASRGSAKDLVRWLCSLGNMTAFAKENIVSLYESDNSNASMQLPLVRTSYLECIISR